MLVLSKHQSHPNIKIENRVFARLTNVCASNHFRCPLNEHKQL